jgi:ribosomal protein L29
LQHKLRKNLFDLRRTAAVENLDTTRRTKERATNVAA